MKQAEHGHGTGFGLRIGGKRRFGHGRTLRSIADDMNMLIQNRLTGQVINLTPALPIAQAALCAEDGGCLRRNDIQHISAESIAEFSDDRFAAGMKFNDRIVRQRMPFNQTVCRTIAIMSPPARFKQSLFGKTALGIQM